jgi:leucyl-tRNA synthetase
MHPLGWDSFGMPAENAAIKHGIHPAKWTRANIEEMKGQIQKMGISYDWDREIATFMPEYYRWNQWFFLQMWKRGDVFRANRNVNWCEALGTVLANEQVVDGKDERTGHPVVQKPMEQYFFHITKYSDELLSGHDQLDWPDNVKAMQRHWVGRSEGAKVWFDLSNGEKIQVFTTRLDTLFGVTFMAFSTEHPFIEKAAESDPGLKAFCEQVAHMSREDRLMSDIKLVSRRGWRPSIPSRARRCRCLPPTTCSWTTAPARSWACPPMTSAITPSPRNTASPFPRSSRPWMVMR